MGDWIKRQVIGFMLNRMGTKLDGWKLIIGAVCWGAAAAIPFVAAKWPELGLPVQGDPVTTGLDYFGKFMTALGAAHKVFKGGVAVKAEDVQAMLDAKKAAMPAPVTKMAEEQAPPQSDNDVTKAVTG